MNVVATVESHVSYQAKTLKDSVRKTRVLVLQVLPSAILADLLPATWCMASVTETFFLANVVPQKLNVPRHPLAVLAEKSASCPTETTAYVKKITHVPLIMNLLACPNTAQGFFALGRNQAFA